MTLPSAGVLLSLNQIHVEAGGTSGTTVSLNESDIRGLISKDVNTSNSISEYYGASSISIQSGDGFFHYLTMSQNPNNPFQPDPQSSAIFTIVKLGGNIVKGNINSATGAYLFQGPLNHVVIGANQSSYTHTNGQVFVPNTQIVISPGSGSNITNHFPNTSFPSNLSAYDDFGIKLQGT